MQINYNPRTMEDYARQLYREAKQIILASTTGHLIVGVLLGAGLWLVAGKFAAKTGKIGTPDMEILWLCMGVGGLLFGIAGYARGKAKAFRLALEAQQTLCQVQTENHLREVVELLKSQQAAPTNK